MDGKPATANDAQHAAELLDLGDAFFEVDRAWRVVRVNRNHEKLSHTPRTAALGRVIWELWPETASATSYWRELHRCMDQRVPVQFEEYVAPLETWTAVTAYPVGDAGIAVFLRDVTGVKRAEAAAREREVEARRKAAEVEAVLGSVAEGVLVYDRDGRIVRSNAAADAIFTYDARERGMGIAERIAAGRYEWFDEAGRRMTIEEMPPVRAARSGETHRGVVGRLRSAGCDRWLRMSAAPLVVGGERIGAVMSVSDITDRKRAEEALREREERFRLLTLAMPQIVCVLAPDGAVEYVNPSWIAFSGLDLEATSRTGWAGVLHGDDLPVARDCLLRVLKQLEPQDVEVRYRAADGSYRWFLSRLAPVVEGGRVLRLVGAAMEIEDRKRAEVSVREANERLREADRRKNEFLGMLSHELRNPLAPIRNALYLLERADPAGPQARRAKEVVSRQVTHLTRLVDDLLDVTRIARGRIELRRADVDLAALARRTADDHRPLMDERGLDLAVDVPPDRVVVNGDETRLAQVLGNLLSNAAKFTPRGGRVTLALAGDGGNAVIRVRDTGPGIAPHLLETIFDPFTQGEQTLARSEGGLGLGLALVKALARLHGGEVTASSSEPGAEFVVTIPLVRSSP